MTPKTSFLRSFALGAFALVATLLPAPSSAQANPSRDLLAPRNPQALATAVDSGLMPSSQRVSLILTLTPDPARATALDQLLAALTTPSSPSYHQWLTPAQFASAYGSTPDQLAAAAAWAQGAGLSVDATDATRITVSGPAGKVQAAFATSLHLYQIDAAVYYASATPASLPAAAAALFGAVEGLDNLPASTVFSSADFPSLTAQMDSNAGPILALTGTSAISAAQLPEYTLLFRQAAAQGITVLLPAAAGSFADATSIADASTPQSTTLPRPTWQYAAGLPADNFRDTPDLAAPSVAALTQTLTTIAGTDRLGNVAPVLYQLAPVVGLFTQRDSAPAGTWEPGTGLGMVDLDKLATSFPRGTGMSYTSFAATNYSPTHGQATSFTSQVTSGTGGGTPTGTVSFTTSAGVTLGTVTLVNGSASLTVSNLSGGNFTIGAVYSGDSTYASSQSPTSQIYVAPEPSQLSAAVSGSPTVGSSFTVTVTDTVTLGVPTGAVTLAISGTSTALTQTLTPATANSATATFSVPSPPPGGITLSINCTTTANYSCYNPYTTSVQIAKATPVLSISYTPNPPVSGQQITLNGVVSTIGSAPAPTGSVTFSDNGTVLNAGTLSGGSTSTTGTVPTTATHSITATYSGDSNYNSASTTGSSSTSGTITTSTAVTSSATTVNAGASITFTATVTPASTGPASPTGTVQFFDGGTSLGTANLAGNVAMFTTNRLSSTSSHTITAVYSGDGYYSTSTSNTVTLTSGTSSNNTTTTLTSSTTTPVHGTSATLTATVTPPTSGATPTGTVTFSSSAGTLATSPLVNGVASYTYSQLSGGATNLTATYNGSATYSASTSATLTITVQPEPSNLTLALGPNATFGSPFAVGVNVGGSSPYGVPTGVVTGTPTGTGYSTSVSANLKTPPGTVNGASGVNLIFQATGAGSVIVSVTYAGDNNFAAAGPVTTTVPVARAASTVSLSLSPSPVVTGQPTLFTAKVSFIAAIAPTGSITFYDGTTIVGTGVLDATGTATYSSTLAAGNHVLSAGYTGDLNYLPGTSPATNTTTGTAASTTSLTLTPASIASGSTVTLMATVTGTAAGPVPTGTVQFLSSGVVLCTATLSGGNASCSYIPTTAGNSSIAASYLGDSTYSASTSPVSILVVTVAAGALTATLAPNPPQGNSPATITATVTAPAGTIPTGSLMATISSNGGGAGTGVQSTYTTPLPGNGTSNTATVQIPVVTPQPSGNYVITVSCVNTNFSCTSVTIPFTLGTTTTGTATLTAIVSPATALPNSTATVTGTITAPTGTTLTGTVTATIAGVTGAVYTVTLPGTAVTTGMYSIPISVPATAGAYTVTVICTSNAFTCIPVTAALTSSTTALIATTTKLVATLSQTATGATVFTATVTPSTTATTVPTGTVILYDGTTPVGIGTLTAAGTASFSLTQNLTVTHSYTAVYSGDTVYAGSTSTAVTGTGASTPAAITLAASTSVALSGQNVVLTATVTGLTATGAGPTGSVSFYITGASARLLGTVTLTSTGAGVATAVLTTSGLPSGNLTIDAVYSGDTNFTTVTSNLVTLGTTDFSVTFNPPTLTIIRGGSGFATATVNFLGGLTGNVTLGCTPAADSYVTCSFSPAVLNASGTSTLTIQTTAPRTALNSPGGLRTGVVGGISFAALLGLVLPFGRRRRLPALLALLVSAGVMAGLGCSANNFNSSPLASSGSPLGTTILTITTAGSDGTNTVRHTYYYQVTIE